MGMGPLENAASAVEAAAAVESDAVGAAAATLLPSSAAGVPVAAPSAGSYAVLQCGEDSEYVREAYNGYFQVFRALLEEDGEAWRVYRALRGELPTDAEAAGFDGFVISGSCADAHGDEPWILALVDLIRRLHAAGKRILGVCFGHQLPVHMPVIEFHQDEVWDLPPSAEVLARSDKTRVEMFRLGDRVMGVQGHPEYSKDILMSIADRLLRHNLILDCQVDVAKASFDVRQPDKELWKKVCRGFLKGRLQSQQKQQVVVL